MTRQRKPECRVFVGNLDYRTTAQDLRMMFSGHGEIRDVFFPVNKKMPPPPMARTRHPDEPVNYGCAFIEFLSREQAVTVSALKDLQDPYSRPIYISNASPV